MPPVKSLLQKVAAPSAPDIPSRMEVGLITGQRTTRLTTVDVPIPADGQVLIRIRATAICTWEQRTYTGAESNRLPFAGGHETAGEVVVIGGGAGDGLRVGDRVTLGPASCGRCHYCLTGRDRACPAQVGQTVTYGDAWGPGGFGEYKAHPVGGVYLIGDAPFEEAALAEPLSCAIHASRLAAVSLAEDAVVIGAGVMGLLNLLVLRLHGARVIVVELDPSRLALATQLGAADVVDASREDAVERVRALTEGRGADVVIAATGGAVANEQGMAMVAERGRYVLFASAHPEPELVLRPNHVHNHETSVIGSFSKDRQDFYAATRLIRHGLVDLAPLVEASYPLSQLSAALEYAARPETYRVIVKP